MKPRRSLESSGPLLVAVHSTGLGQKGFRGEEETHPKGPAKRQSVSWKLHVRIRGLRVDLDLFESGICTLFENGKCLTCWPVSTSFLEFTWSVLQGKSVLNYTSWIHHTTTSSSVFVTGQSCLYRNVSELWQRGRGVCVCPCWVLKTALNGYLCFSNINMFHFKTI